MNVHPACLVRENAAEIWGRNGLGQNGKAQITADTMRRSVERCSVVGMYCYLLELEKRIKICDAQMERMRGILNQNEFDEELVHELILNKIQ